jgi:hypothetical protein
MPSREQTVQDAIQIFEKADYPDGLTPATAWQGVYQTLLWYEPVNWVGIEKLPHIIDADKLRPASAPRRQSWNAENAWQKRAILVEEHLAATLKCAAQRLPEKVDLLMKQPGYRGMQRQNSLGTAFAGLTKHILEKFGSKRVSYETEVDAGAVFPGITFPGRSSTPRIDVLAIMEGTPSAIISAKWSLRHDRLNDITNECPVYKAAYQRIFRQARFQHLRFYVITNEYDPARLSKLLSDSCVDSLVHVHKAAVVEVCKLNSRLQELKDLEDLVRATWTW